MRIAFKDQATPGSRTHVVNFYRVGGVAGGLLDFTAHEDGTTVTMTPYRLDGQVKINTLPDDLTPLTIARVLRQVARDLDGTAAMTPTWASVLAAIATEYEPKREADGDLVEQQFNDPRFH